MRDRVRRAWLVAAAVVSVVMGLGIAGAPTPVAADPPPIPASIAESSIDGGSQHTCAIGAAGEPVCWGSNSYRQSGGTSSWASLPRAVGGIPKAIAHIAAGYEHTCAIDVDGGVWCWGRNQHGQLGTSTGGASAPSPLQVAGLGQPAVSLGLGMSHSCAVLADGTARCWGLNTWGQLGNGSTTSSVVPVPVSGLSDVVQMAASQVFSCARTASGRVACWGSNASGQLGTGGTVSSTSPVVVPGLAGVEDLTAGLHHVCAVHAGAVSCWGGNSSRQVGQAGTFRSPAPVPGLPAAAGDVDASDAQTCVLLVDGEVWCWGASTQGSVVANLHVDAAPPTRVGGLGGDVRELSVGSAPCALRGGGTIVCWGTNASGYRGTDDWPDSTATPMQVPGLPGPADALDAGSGSTCTRHDGEAWCWGSNLPDPLSDRFAWSAVPLELDAGGSVDALAPGSHSCALVVGAARCWGWNAAGELGTGTNAWEGEPTTVTGLSSGVTSIATGLDFTCAVQSGAASCWGRGGDGQLGRGSTDDALVPGPVTGLSSGVLSVHAGSTHACAISTGGAVRCWGANDRGQLGIGVFSPRSSVPALAIASGAVDVSIGDEHTCFLLSSGLVRCAGSDDFQQLGDGWDDDAPAATAQLVPGLSGVTSLGGDGLYQCAVATGALRCWGYSMERATGFAYGPPQPTTVPGFETGVVEVAAGGGHTCVRKVDGTVWCFGSDWTGALGSGRWVPGPAVEYAPGFRTAPPSIVADVSAEPNAAGWYGAEVTVSFSCSGGTPPLDCPDPVVVGEGADQSVTRTVTDAAGQSTTATVSGLDIDLTGPTVTTSIVDVDGVPVARFACADALSGVASCPADVPLGPDGTVSEGQAIDVAGNSSAVAEVRSRRSVFGQPVTLVASPGQTSGQVVFAADGKVLGSRSVVGGVTELTTTALGVGVRTITLSWRPTPTSPSTPFATWQHHVGRAATQVELERTVASPTVYGQPVVFRATVSVVAPGGGRPSGKVRFRDGSTVLATKNLSGGVASYSASALAVGDRTITAEYLGGTYHAPSVGAGALEHRIDPAGSTTSLTVSHAASVAGQNVELRADVAAVAPSTRAPSGIVDFYDGDVLIASASVSNGKATVRRSLAVGAHALRAQYRGTATGHVGSSSTVVAHEVLVAPTMVTVTSSYPVRPLGGTGVLRARVLVPAPGKGTPSGMVTFLRDGDVLATLPLSKGSATLSLKHLPVGAHQITAVYHGAASFAPSVTASPYLQVIT